MAIDASKFIVFLHLTSAVDNSTVLVNVSQIRAIYKYNGKDTTVVDYSGNEDGYVDVKESVDDIEKMLQEMR